MKFRINNRFHKSLKERSFILERDELSDRDAKSYPLGIILFDAFGLPRGVKKEVKIVLFPAPIRPNIPNYQPLTTDYDYRTEISPPLRIAEPNLSRFDHFEFEWSRTDELTTRDFAFTYKPGVPQPALSHLNRIPEVASGGLWQLQFTEPGPSKSDLVSFTVKGAAGDLSKLTTQPKLDPQGEYYGWINAGDGPKRYREVHLEIADRLVEYKGDVVKEHTYSITRREQIGEVEDIFMKDDKNVQ